MIQLAQAQTAFHLIQNSSENPVPIPEGTYALSADNTLDLKGKTIRSDDGAIVTLVPQNGGTITITNSGGVATIKAGTNSKITIGQ